MKLLQVVTLFAIALLASDSRMNAQAPATSAQVVEVILSVTENRDELSRLESGITTLLADQRLTDQATRQMLSESQTVLTELLDQKVGTNAGKLVDLAEWLRTQEEEKHVIQDAEGAPSQKEQFILDNSMAGSEVYLTALLNSILGSYLEIDRENAGQTKLEALLQLYLKFHVVIERSWWLADNFLLYAPQWTQSRYPQLSQDQKRQFLKDVNDARVEKSLGPAADEEPTPAPTAQEEAAYESAYEFIVNNTPQP